MAFVTIIIERKLIFVAFDIAFFSFFWGGVKGPISLGKRREEEKRERGKGEEKRKKDERSA